MTANEFIAKFPERVNPAVLEGLSTVFHFDISGEGGGQQTVTVADGKLEVQDGLIGDAKCVVKAEAGNLIKIVNGDMNPMMAVFSGKLKLSNQGEMLKYAKIFGLM